MSLLMWNCRGLGIPGTVQELARLVREKDPLVLFVVESGLDNARLEVLRCQFHFSSKLVVPRREQGGGLAMFWKQEAHVSIKSFSHHHIDAIIDEGEPNSWRFTGFYGAPETHRRHESWSLLRLLHSQSSLPWCCMGDFNELLSYEEKQGGPIRSHRQMQDFRDAIDHCGFEDLGFNGPPFTWCNNRLGSHTVWERLDRVLATTSWISLFPLAQVQHLHAVSSDHNPISIQFSPSPSSRPRSNRIFRFEEMWLSHPGCKETITSAWQTQKHGTAMFQVHDKLRTCRNSLRQWSRDSFGNVTSELKKKTQMLREAESESMKGKGHAKAHALKREVNTLLNREECMWRQRSRKKWLRWGDKNTSFFHHSATQRRRRNLISEIQDNHGNCYNSEEDIARTFEDHFVSLFSSSHPTEFDSVLSGVHRVVTDEMNAELVREFTAEEVDTALKQMAPSTAPGPDGMSPLFYQSCWSLVGSDVSQAILSCLNSGSLLKAVNHTYITLIPKTQTPKKVSDFRPISLCNVIYKILSKVITN
jgi:hypothetical protein